MSIKQRLKKRPKEQTTLFQVRMAASLYKRLTKYLKVKGIKRWEFVEAAAKELLGEK